jgi:hypothetical protein
MITSRSPARPTAWLCLAAAACVALASSLTPQVALAQEQAREVTVLGRNWVVAPAEQAPGLHRAVRLNETQQPFRPPAVLSARQAVRAFHRATGCSANLDTLYRDITGAYFARLICPRQ